MLWLSELASWLSELFSTSDELLPVDELPVDELPVDELPVDELACSLPSLTMFEPFSVLEAALELDLLIVEDVLEEDLLVAEDEDLMLAILDFFVGEDDDDDDDLRGEVAVRFLLLSPLLLLPLEFDDVDTGQSSGGVWLPESLLTAMIFRGSDPESPSPDPLLVVCLKDDPIGRRAGCEYDDTCCRETIALLLFGLLVVVCV